MSNSTVLGPCIRFRHVLILIFPPYTKYAYSLVDWFVCHLFGFSEWSHDIAQFLTVVPNLFAAKLTVNWHAFDKLLSGNPIESWFGDRQISRKACAHALLASSGLYFKLSIIWPWGFRGSRLAPVFVGR